MTTRKVLLVTLFSLAGLPFFAATADVQQVQVTAATTSEAPQGTLSLDVTVSGSGFDSSAQVDFLVTGTTNSGGAEYEPHR